MSGRPSRGTRGVGDRGEGIAWRHLEGEGYELVERNHRTRMGEVDLVVRRGSTLVFVEVKMRRGTGFGDPLEAITARKRERIRALAEEYLAERPALAEGLDEVRFDAVGILREDGGRLRLRHVEDAF